MSATPKTKSPRSAEQRVPLMHELIRDQLASRLGRDWPVGAQLPPIGALARQLGTGYQNTHRAVQQLVRDGLLMTRRGRGTFVCDTADSADAGSTSATKTDSAVAGKTIAIVRSNDDHMIDQIVDPATERLRQAGANAICISHRSGEVGKQVADGAIVINCGKDIQAALRKVNPITVVDTSQYLPLSGDRALDFVSVDSRQGGFLAGEWLRRIKCKSVCLIGCDRGPHEMTLRARFEGFAQGWTKPITDAQSILLADWTTVCGAQAVSQYLTMKPRPRAVFCASDDLAVGFVHGAHSHGMAAGIDYQIIGFDGQQRGRDIPGGPLTTIDIPTAAMGRAAAEMLISRMGRPDEPARRLHLACTLFPGNTAAKRTG